MRSPKPGLGRAGSKQTRNRPGAGGVLIRHKIVRRQLALRFVQQPVPQPVPQPAKRNWNKELTVCNRHTA